jgi:hypothetical protein
LDPLSIFSTFKPRELSDFSFIQQFSDLVHGLYPFTPCISTREYYYLLQPFLLHLLPSTIFLVDPLKSFESAILSNKFSFNHFLGYMNNMLSLMKKENLTASALELIGYDIRRTHNNFSSWYLIKWENSVRKRLFNLCLKDVLYSTAFECPFDQRAV